MLITVVCLFLFLDMLLLIQVILEEFILLHVKIGSIWINMQRDLQHCSSVASCSRVLGMSSYDLYPVVLQVISPLRSRYVSECQQLF